MEILYKEILYKLLSGNLVLGAELCQMQLFKCIHTHIYIQNDCGAPFIHHPHSPSAINGAGSPFSENMLTPSQQTGISASSAPLFFITDLHAMCQRWKLVSAVSSSQHWDDQLMVPRAALSSPSCRPELHWWWASPLAQHLIVMVGYVPWPAVSHLKSFSILIWMPSGADYLLAFDLYGWFNISCTHLLSGAGSSGLFVASAVKIPQHL